MLTTRPSNSTFAPQPPVLLGDDCEVPAIKLTPSQPLIVMPRDDGGFEVAHVRAPLENTLSIREVMTALGYSNATSFMVMARRENLPFFKINSSVYRFPISGVNDWLRHRSATGLTTKRRVNLGKKERRQFATLRASAA